jgi:hypothetical protein
LSAARRLAAIVLLGMAGVAVPAPPPALGSAADVLDDCIQDGRLDGSYSRGELRRALEQLPSDQDEYSACRDLIDEALVAMRDDSPPAPGGSSPSGAPGGGAPGGSGPGAGAEPSPGAASPPPPPPPSRPTSADNRALERAVAGRRAPSLAVAGERVTRNAGGLLGSSRDHPIPAPLLAVLAMLALLGAVVSLAHGPDRLAPLLRVARLRR